MMAPFKQFSDIPQVAPHWFLGNKSFGGESMKDTYLNHYNALKGHRFGLFWEGNRPTIFLKDLDLIKKVQVGDFEHFADNAFTRLDYRLKVGNVFGVADMLGEEGWRKMKRSVTPPFSVPRLKKSVPAMNAAAEKLGNYLKLNEKNEFVESTDFARKFFMNLISSVVFGTDIDCYGETESEFEKKGKALISVPRYLLVDMFPTLAILFKITMMNPDSEKFFSNLVRRIISQRKNTNLEVKDILGNLMQVGEENPDMTEEMMYKTCVQFFTDGYEGTAQAISVLMYHLTIHPEIQERIQNEIDDVYESKDKDEIEEKDLNEMPYLDQVILEGFRLGCVPSTARICTKDWKIPGDNFVIPKGMKVTIPIIGLHYDPKYWTDPAKFDPDRFSPENRGNIDGATNQPFGFGPRACLGQNLVRIESKIMLIQLLRIFSLKPYGHMPEEMVWDADAFIGSKSVKVKIVSRV